MAARTATTPEWSLVHDLNRNWNRHESHSKYNLLLINFMQFFILSSSERRTECHLSNSILIIHHQWKLTIHFNSPIEIKRAYNSPINIQHTYYAPIQIKYSYKQPIKIKYTYNSPINGKEILIGMTDLFIIAIKKFLYLKILWCISIKEWTVVSASLKPKIVYPCINQVSITPWHDNFPQGIINCKGTETFANKPM